MDQTMDWDNNYYGLNSRLISYGCKPGLGLGAVLGLGEPTAAAGRPLWQAQKHQDSLHSYCCVQAKGDEG